MKGRMRERRMKCSNEGKNKGLEERKTEEEIKKFKRGMRQGRKAGVKEE